MPAWVFDYCNMRGHVTLRTAYAKLLEKTWVKVPVDPECLSFQAGASCILDQLSWCLCEDGNSMITAAPLYPAFPNDFKARGRVNMEIIKTQESNLYIAQKSELEDAFKKCAKRRSKGKILLICNPINPTGQILSEENLNMYIDFAESKGMHIICDEIYGNSVFPGEHVTSIAEVMKKRNPEKEKYMGDFCHIVAGFSKDFCMSGLRVGTLFSHNSAMNTCLDSLGLFSAVSNQT